MPQISYLPIKVVLPHDHDFVPDSPGGSQWEPFCVVDSKFRRDMNKQIDEVKKFITESFGSTEDIPAVAKVTLRPEAVAKTYRPGDLLNDNTCPIIGGNRLGELYVSATPTGLERLERQIESNESRRGVAQISTLLEVKPYRIEDVLDQGSIEELIVSARRKNETRLRFRLFRHHLQSINDRIDKRFRKLARACEAEAIEQLHYADGMSVYCLKNVPRRHLLALATFAGTQKLSSFPLFRIVRTASHAIGSLSANHLPHPDARVSYPTVGIIDSGTDPKNTFLQAWVTSRLDVVPRSMQDNEHGSFVAGLIAHSRKLNNDDPRFPNVSARIVDVVAFDRSNEADEYDLLPIIDQAISKFPDVKIWNLSLSLADKSCSDHEVSEIASALDDRSRKHGILFVIAAGNYREQPFRTWPPQSGLGEADRICAPADAIRAITVGSVAHLDSARSRVRRGEPSPFSRRGPGPAYLPKPELCFFGGNCDENGAYIQTGIISVNGKGQLAENAGTSFATPLASSLLANLYHELSVKPKNASPTYLKAIAIHSAFVHNAPLDKDLFDYCGVGTPPRIAQMLRCDPHSCTVILDVPARSQLVFGKRPFPIPRCLIENNVFKGEVFMTLVYDPPMARQYGIEYCRCNVNASLGVMRRKPGNPKPVYSREVPPVPDSLRAGYEEELIKHGYKWSPIKLYHRLFKRGPASTQWRLTLEMLTRVDAPMSEQPVTLIVTVRDPARKAKVYEEMIKEMDQLKWLMQDLAVRSRLRFQM